MSVNQEETVCQELPKLLLPIVLCILIRGQTAEDATVIVNTLRGVWPTPASGIGRLDCDAYAVRLFIISDPEIREFDVGWRLLVNIASHIVTRAEWTMNFCEL